MDPIRRPLKAARSHAQAKPSMASEVDRIAAPRGMRRKRQSADELTAAKLLAAKRACGLIAAVDDDIPF